jgi:hypothetical protein
MKYTIYNLESGQIISIRDCPDITQQILDPSYSYIEGEYSGTEYYIDNGTPIVFPTHTYTYPLFDYETKTWSEDIRRITNDVLTKRKNFLINTDWTQLPNNPLTTEKQIAWANYRQELRDITIQSGYPSNITWPTKPN